MTMPATPDHLIDTDLFISHATTDDGLVSQLDAALNAAGLTTWVDHEYGIAYGDRWQDAIQDATLRCRAALFVLTPESAKSQWCQRELTQVQEHLKRKIYVVKAAPVPSWQIPLIVNNSQYKDLSAAKFDNPADPVLRGLIDALKGNATFTETITETRRTQRITGAYPFNDLLYTLYGRETDMGKLAEWLTSDAREVPIAQLLGIGGVGKTRLAAEVVDTLDFRDGTIWFKFDKTFTDYDNSPARLAEFIRDHLNLPPGDESAAWRALNGQQILLVMDNAEDCPASQRGTFASRIRALRDGPRVLVTSRHAWEELSLSAHHEHDLHAPSAADGVRILSRMAEVSGYQDRLDGQTAELAEKSFYHPRLMLYAVGWLKANPPQAVIRALEMLKGREVEKALEEMVGRTLNQMTDQEGEAPLRALKRLNVTVGGFDRDATEALLAETAADDPILSDLTTLTAWNLLEYDGKRYAIDPLVVRAAGVDDSAREAHAEYYASRIKQQHKKQDYVALEPDSGNLEVAFFWALYHKSVDLALNIAYFGGFYLNNRGRIRDRFKWAEYSALLTDEVSDPIQWAWARHNLGIAYLGLSTLEERSENLHRAITAHREALKYRIPTVDMLDFAATQNNLGNDYSNLSMVEDPEENLQRAVAAYEESLHYCTPETAPVAYAQTQNNLGIAYHRLSEIVERNKNLHRAVMSHQKALSVYTIDSAQLDYAATQTYLGAAYSDLSTAEEPEANLSRAIAAYQEALKYHTQTASPFGYAQTQNNLGNAYSDLSKFESQEENLLRAINAYYEALKYFTPTTTPLDYAITQFNLGLVFTSLGKNAQACAALHEAELYYRAGERIEMADRLATYMKQSC